MYYTNPKVPVSRKSTVKFKEISENVFKPEDKADLLPEGIKGKVDLSTKPHLAAIDPYLLMETGLAFRYGQKKHGKDNFRKMTPDAAQELFDALLRHLIAYQAGETHAGDSEVHHLGHVVANCSMLFRLIKKFGDDKVLKVISGGDYGK